MKGADRHLTAEFDAVEAAGAQFAPELFLRLRRLAPHGAGEAALERFERLMRHRANLTADRIAPPATQASLNADLPPNSTPTEPAWD